MRFQLLHAIPPPPDKAIKKPLSTYLYGMFGSIKDIHWMGQLLILVGIYLITEFLFFYLANGIISAMYPDLDIMQLLTSLNNIKSADEITKTQADALKWYQAITSIGRFMLVSLVFLELRGERPGGFLGLQTNPKPIQWITIPFILLSAMLVIGVIEDWNAGLHLPAGMQDIENTMRMWESQAKIQTDVFLRTDTISGLLVNILVICIIAGIGEEMLFRGVIQGAIEKGTGNGHLAIWVSAIIFSAIHMQFFGFFPRLLLGALNGYLMYYSRSLWAPIFAHFLNNMFSVVAFYLMNIGVIENDITTKSSLWGGLIAVPFVFLLLRIYREKQENGKGLDAGIHDHRQDGSDVFER